MDIVLFLLSHWRLFVLGAALIGLTVWLGCCGEAAIDRAFADFGMTSPLDYAKPDVHRSGMDEHEEQVSV